MNRHGSSSVISAFESRVFERLSPNFFYFAIWFVYGFRISHDISLFSISGSAVVPMYPIKDTLNLHDVGDTEVFKRSLSPSSTIRLVSSEVWKRLSMTHVSGTVLRLRQT